MLLPDDNPPLVSIGMPVYNGEKYICKSLDALLDQDYKNIEIIISDNASTDDTYKICEEYKRKDNRIFLRRKNKNEGALVNFNEVLSSANGRYFMWASHDDIYLPGFIKKCIDHLEVDSDIDLCYSSLCFINEEDEFIKEFNSSYDNPDLTASSVFTRLKTWWSQPGWYAIYGIYRINAVRSVMLKEQYGSDVIFITDLLLKGYRGAKIDELLFYYRQYRNKTEYDRYSASVVNRKFLISPHIDLYISLFQSISSADLYIYEKFLLFFILPKSMYPKVRRSLWKGIVHNFNEGNYQVILKLLMFLPWAIFTKIKSVLRIIFWKYSH